MIKKIYRQTYRSTMGLSCNTNLFGVDNPNKSSLACRRLNTVVYGYRATGLPKFASNGVAYFKTSAFFSDQGN